MKNRIGAAFGIALATALAFLMIAAQAQSAVAPGSANAAGSPTGPDATRATRGQAIFYVLITGIASNQRPEYWGDRLQDASITPEEMNKLRAYANQARNANLEFQKNDLARMCAGKDTLTTLDTVSSALNQHEARNARNIEQLGNEAIKSLGDRLGKLLAAAGDRSTFMRSQTDHKQMMTEMKKEPVTHIQSICSKSSARSSP